MEKKSYYKETIRLDGLCTTIPVMEKIRELGCPELDHTYFVDSHGGCAIVSYMYESEWGDTIDYLNEQGDEIWYDYKGMKRTRDIVCGWVFLIDGHYYFATF